MNGRLNELTLDEYQLVGHSTIERSGLFDTYGNDVMVHVLEKTEAILAQVKRWEEGKYQHLSGGNETNREHVLGMHDILERYYIYLEEVCDMQELIIAFDGHDIGEFIIKDIDKTAPNVEIRKALQKPRERRVALSLMGAIKDESLKVKAEEMFERYYNFDLNDLTILITKIIDRLQGFTYGLGVTFLENYQQETINDEKLFEHIKECVVEIAGLLLILRIKAEQKDSKSIRPMWHFSHSVMRDLHQKILDNYGLDLKISEGDYIIGAVQAFEKFGKQAEFAEAIAA